MWKGCYVFGQKVQIIYKSRVHSLLNPEVLKSYDGEASVRLIDRELFGCEQLVNRSDGVVDGVYVHGQRVWQGTNFSPPHGETKLGAALRVRN